MHPNPHLFPNMESQDRDVGFRFDGEFRFVLVRVEKNEETLPLESFEIVPISVAVLGYVAEKLPLFPFT